MQALAVLEATLRSGEPSPPAALEPIHLAFASSKAKTVEPAHLEAEFCRIDAMWAAWFREGPAAARNGETVARHARMTLLAAVDQATSVANLLRVAGALARARLGHPLTDGDRKLGSDPAAERARPMLEGQTVRFWTVNGVIGIEPPSVEQLAGLSIDAAALIPQLFAENGYPEFAERLTSEQTRLLVAAWPREAGRPSGGQRSDWNTIRAVVQEVGLECGKTLNKDWQEFRLRRVVKET
jgi:hypothetical protein